LESSVIKVRGPLADWLKPILVSYSVCLP